VKDPSATGNPRLSRRELFARSGSLLYGTALASILGQELFRTDPLLASGGENYDLRPRTPHFDPKAKAVIHLFMNGGPSQVDLFDPKPLLQKYAGTVPNRDLTSDITSPTQSGGLLPSPYSFARHGQSGMELSELMPHLANCVDDIALIRSMYGAHFNHEPAIFFMQTGRTVSTRPSVGAWVAYGLGTENQNLPAYVVLDDPKGLPINDIQNWQAGFLPAVYQGTRVRSEGSPLLNLHPREEWPSPVVKLSRSLLRHLDRNHLSRHPDEAELEARIAGYELAARMQMAASDALDVSGESEATKEMYGLNDELTASYGKRCLMARRLVERGVRLVQIYIEGQIWDNHSALVKNLGYACGKTDKPAAALLKDLKLRGLLNRTLVVWGGEFGRLPIAQQPASGEVGRDHGPSGFSVWLAGGGVKGGTVYGATDDIGYKAAENPVSVHDFHATILHLLGMNHRQLIFEREGRSERLTDEFPARVVQDIIA
jgi:hypothetical protein